MSFGDQIAIGIFLGLLEDVTPEEAYEYIKSNHSCIDEFPEEAWQNFRQQIQALNVKLPNAEQILDVLKEDHLDLASIIINTPSGKKWLESELDKAKEKLG